MIKTELNTETHKDLLISWTTGREFWETIHLVKTDIPNMPVTYIHAHKLVGHHGTAGSFPGITESSTNLGIHMFFWC